MIQIDNLDLVKKILDEDKVGTANFYGAIKYQKNVKMFTDNLENPTGVLVKGERFYFIHSNNDDFIRRVRDDFLDEGVHEFSGVSKRIASILKEKDELVWEEFCHLYYLPKENLKKERVRNIVKPIDLKDVEIINDHYYYKDEHSEQKLTDNIKQRPSAAIYEDDELVSWVMTHNEGSMGVMYTLEKARKKDMQ